jgi:flagellin
VAITLGSNIPSLKAQRELNKGTDALSKVFERLSSGQRINRASDDAAGLAIASSLNTDARIYSAAIRNINDGVSLINIADAALQSLGNIASKLTELSEQSANGVLSNLQRKSLDDEAQALAKEWNRVAQSTTFNGQRILNSSFGSLSIQVGSGTDEVISSTLGGTVATGNFGSETLYSNTREGVRDQALADLNNDGHLDLISQTTNLTGSGSHSVRVRMNQGNGTFGAATHYSILGANSSVIPNSTDLMST